VTESKSGKEMTTEALNNIVNMSKNRTKNDGEGRIHQASASARELKEIHQSNLIKRKYIILIIAFSIFCLLLLLANFA